MNHVPRRRWFALPAIPVALSLMFLGGTGSAPAAAAQSQTAAQTAPGSAAQGQTTAGSASGPGYAPACGGTVPADGYTCFSERRTNVHEPAMITPDSAAAAPAGYGPSDIQSAYSLPAATGSPLVAVVDAYDDPDAESDLAMYREQFGLPACTTANGCFQKVGQDGSATSLPPTPPPGDDWGTEISLDLDAVSAACPGCRILLVEASTDVDQTSLPAAVVTARNLGATIISMSWGGHEQGDENSLDSQFFDVPGVVYTASSGDNSFGAGPIYPSTSQYTVSVGGTSLESAPGSARGWSESAWDGAGSGCSSDVAKPAFQDAITACANRADTDISADADPDTGLAVYNTFSDTGWDVVGGTSLSAPLVAGMYAVAGGPAAGTDPASYPYSDPHQAADINDVTTGSNGGCSPAVLCTAGPGWDGPTGLGTPNGVGALQTGNSGDITGQVTSAATGGPVAGATVTATGGFTATTSSDGDYSLGVPPGSYDLTVTDFGFAGATVPGVTVTAGSPVTENFALTAEPVSTISGTVRDGSGHKWPMRAKITVSGVPGGTVFSSPFNGTYSITVPDSASYTLSVSAADVPGYTSKQVTVSVGTTDVTKNIALTVDPATCTAPGYAFTDTGLTESFTGWTGNTPQDGWSVTDSAGTGQTWRFDNPGQVSPPPGGDADFADVNSDFFGEGGQQDTDLESPVVDLTQETSPEIGFDGYYTPFPGQEGEVDLSLDGGTTWTEVFDPVSFNPGRFDVPIPQAAGQPDVRIRFHFTGSWARQWGVDNVLVGDHTCSPVPGGVADGVVRDANTGSPVNGATVTSKPVPADTATSGPATADPGLPDGYYWVFSSHAGATTFTTTDGNYAATAGSVTITRNAATRTPLTIDAGQLTVSSQNVPVSEVLGAVKTKTVTFGNSGTAPVSVSLSGEAGRFTAMGTSAGAAAAAPGAAPDVVPATTSLAAVPGSGAAGQGVTAHQAIAQAAPWADVADYPEAIMDDAVAAHDGKTYVVGGSNGTFAVPDANVYDPAAGTWSAIAPLPEPLNAMSAAFIGGTLYAAGGWDSLGNPSATLYAYDPSANTWSQKASMPAPRAAAGVAVAGGKLYVIGGCTGSICDQAATVYSYDPGNNAWTQQPDYPAAMAFPACGGVDGAVICAGGNGAGNATYSYTPGAASWTQEADMPSDAWGAAAASANGQLEVIGGAVNNGLDVTNQSSSYDPDTNTWSPLPDPSAATYRGGAACGIYKVGGSIGQFQPVPFTENLPGYSQCDGAVTWMSMNTTSFTLSPGQTTAVTVTADSSAQSQPGTYAAQIISTANMPYPSLEPVTVTMTVKPPASWGKITGTVTDTAGAPVSGATVAICTMYATKTGLCGPQTYTLTTNGNGQYQLWLSKGFSPLEIIAAKDGYTPATKIARITAGAATTASFVLAASSSVTQTQVQHYLTTQLRTRSG